MLSNREQNTIRCEWGLKGIKSLASKSDVIIIVDVLSFSTAVDIACENGAMVYPFNQKGEDATEFAESKGAIATSNVRSKEIISLSPASLQNISSDTKLVLPSPNGSTLSLSTGSAFTLCACLRNYRAVAEFASNRGGKISVIPAGEKWDDGSMRFALEDYIGAGAVITCLKGSLSSESEAAKNVFMSLQDKLKEIIDACISGQELINRGFKEDVDLSVELNVSNCIPVLKDGFYINANTY